ncbi:lysophosphatidic acid receptor 5-like [Coregonus clupeaformis]|uniref:lysophosphatidic acid receptor 5-like n=1 Tax=Coregonus clupeaformis TaxID=59861 RepID=UPI001BE00943|nr:lysophosphatidic acid receptor 5-like [Coregonus clupeaformis]
MTNTTCNITHYRYPLFTATYSGVLALGLPLNTLSLGLLLCRLGLRSMPVIYMANLALSDLLFTLSMPLRILYYARGHWPYGHLACMVSGTLFSINLYSSSYFIMLISVDRFLAVVYPLRSRPLRTPGMAWTACAAVWVVIGAMAVPVALNHRANYHQMCVVWRCFEGYTQEEWRFGLYIFYVAAVLGNVVPFAVIVGCTVAGVRKLRVQKATSSSSFSSSSVDKSRMVWLLVTNLSIYTVCFIPFHVAMVLYGLHKLHYLQSQFPFFGFHIGTICLASVNSCLDPLIYYFSSKILKRGRGTTGTTEANVTVLPNSALWWRTGISRGENARDGLEQVNGGR